MNYFFTYQSYSNQSQQLTTKSSLGALQLEPVWKLWAVSEISPYFLLGFPFIEHYLVNSLAKWEKHLRTPLNRFSGLN